MTDTVTEIDYYNTIVFLGATYWYTRWIRMRIVGELANGVVELECDEAAGKLQAVLRRCACGTQFGIAARPVLRRGNNKPKYSPMSKCKACYLKRAAEHRRRNRQKARALALSHNCAHCGQPMQASRTTRRYCSTACRVKALRARRRPEPKMQAMMVQSA